MLTDHAARVSSGSTRLRAKTRRPGGDAERQSLFFDYRLTHQIGERDLGSRDEPTAIGGMELILGEFRQLSRTEHGFVTHDQRRIDLGIAMLARMQIDHEIAERALEPGKRAFEYHETGARYLRRCLEVHEPHALADL